MVSPMVLHLCLRLRTGMRYQVDQPFYSVLVYYYFPTFIFRGLVIIYIVSNVHKFSPSLIKILL